MAACTVEDVACHAVVRRTRFAVEDLGGRFGGRALGPARATTAEPETDRVTVGGPAATPWRAELGDDALRALFDPAVLIRDFATVSARLTVRRERLCVELDVRPHALWADPESPWCPPGARQTRLVVDAASGFLVDARLMSPSQVIAHYEITELDVARPPADVPPWSGDWREPIPAGAADQAGWALARMAATLMEPAALTAEVEIVAETREAAFAPIPPATTDRVWRVGVTLPGAGARGGPTTPREPTSAAGGPALSGRPRRVLTMGDDYVPETMPFPVARLAELLTPARIVSHLEGVSALSALPTDGRSRVRIAASVRPNRTFPFSAWAPDETVRCSFGVDQETGVLLEAEAHVARVLAHYRVDRVGPLLPGHQTQAEEP